MGGAMTSQEFGRCVHPREFPRFLLALLFAFPVGLSLLGFVLFSNGALASIILLIAFLAWFSLEIFYALLISNWVLVSEHNYPRLNNLMTEMKAAIGVDNKVDMIVLGVGEFNAYFSLLFSRRAIFVTSELLADGVTDDELRWIIGRFVGRIRAKRRMGPIRYAIALVERLIVFNVFIYPYERATAYTGDRVALAAIKGDISSAIAAMNKLMVGRTIGYTVNPAGIARQYRRVKGSLFGFLARVGSPLPHMLARYVDLIGFAEKEFAGQTAQFSAMNPSFQVAGGAWPLVRSTRKYGDGVSNAIGLSLLGGSVVSAVAGAFLLTTMGPMFGLAKGALGGLGGNPTQTFEEPSYESVPEPGSAPAAPLSDDDLAYQAAQQSDSAEAYDHYLARYYPNGAHVAEAQSALSSYSNGDLSGAWRFATASYDCSQGKCSMQGDMEIRRAAGGYSCTFIASETYPTSITRSEESCAISVTADGALTVTSNVLNSTSTSYSADNFSLRRSNDKLTGTLQSGINVAVEFSR